MSDERKTYNIAAETAAKLESEADRQPNESANDFILRVAEELAGSDEHMDVTKYEPPRDALTVDHIDDIVERTARKTADEVEHRLR